MACGPAAGGVGTRTSGVNSTTISLAFLFLVNASDGKLDLVVDCSDLHWPLSMVAHCQISAVMIKAEGVATAATRQRCGSYKVRRCGLPELK